MSYNDYIFQSLADSSQEALSLESIKNWLRLDSCDTSDDEILKMLRDSAVCMFETISRRTLMNSNFITYRDCWESCYELRRSKLVSITQVDYKDEDGNTVIVNSSIYYNDAKEDYSKLIFTEDFIAETLYGRANDITITFVAGLAANTSDVPSDIRIALLNHILFMYENRGDCDCNSVYSIPMGAMTIYNKYKIIEIGC